MNLSLLPLALLASISSATTPVFQEQGWVLEAADGALQNGVGAPAVVYDPGTEQLVMFFEYRVSNEDVDACGGVSYRIGRAVSDDGLQWAVDEELVLAPLDGTYLSCSVAQPAVLLQDGTWHLWFVAKQHQQPCPDTGEESPWGCSPSTGIGYATSTDGVTFTVSADPVVTLAAGESRVSSPAVVWTGDGLHMLYTGDDAIRAAWAASDDDWSTKVQPVVQAGSAAWGTEVDRVGQVCMLCGGADDPTFQAAFIGFNTDLDIHPSTDFALLVRWGTSQDGLIWDLESDPLHEATSAEDEWRHVELLRAGDGYVMWYNAYDYDDESTGRSRIGFATTTDTWEPQDLQGHVCEDQAASRVWVGDDAAPGIWWCNAVGRGIPRGWWLALLPALMGVVRRKERRGQGC